jgi:hypothetical protein
MLASLLSHSISLLSRETSSQVVNQTQVGNPLLAGNLNVLCNGTVSSTRRRRC